MVYVFLHIPKTAGITLRDVLMRLVPRDRINGTPPFPPDEMERRQERIMRRMERSKDVTFWAAREDEGPNSMYAEAYARLPREEFCRLQLFMDHYYYGIHEVIERPVTYLTMLREPVERVLSAHQHLVTRHGLRAPLSQFVETAPGTVDNSQTRRLVGDIGSGQEIRRVKLDDALFEQAKKHLETFGWVGVTERFDESLLALQQAFGLRNICYERQNVGKGRPQRRDVDPSLIERIEEANQYDYRLWRYAHVLLDRQLYGVPPYRLPLFKAMNLLYGPAKNVALRVLRRSSDTD